MVVLDTDLLSLLEWESSHAARPLADRLNTLPDDEIAATIIEEKTRGWLTVLAKAKTIEEQVEAYSRLNQQVRLFANFTVLDFDLVAAYEFKRLRKEHRRLGTMDLKIAAVVLSHNATLLSRNLRDYQQIPGLKVEDWTRE